MADPGGNLSAADVRKVARLARLELSDSQVEEYRPRLAAVLDYMRQLRELDLAGVEPLTQPFQTTGRLAADEPGEALPTERLMEMAPDKHAPFIKVPRVFGEGSGA